MSTPKLSFHVEAWRVEAHGNLARCKQAEVASDTDLAGEPGALNPAELLPAAGSACLIKGIECVAPFRSPLRNPIGLGALPMGDKFKSRVTFKKWRGGDCDALSSSQMPSSFEGEQPRVRPQTAPRLLAEANTTSRHDPIQHKP